MDGVKALSPVDKAAVRCCISRAYYAAYWECRIYLQSDPMFRVDNHGSHRTIIETIEAENVTLSSTLERLFDSRVQADYKNQAVLTRGDSQTAIRRAKEIIDGVRQLRLR